MMAVMRSRRAAAVVATAIAVLSVAVTVASAASAAAEEDEFAGVAAASSTTTSSGSGSGDAATIAGADSEASAAASRSWFRTLKLQGDISGKNTYHIEMIILAVLAVHVLLHFIGAATNTRIMDRFVSHFDAFFDAQFEAHGPPATAAKGLKVKGQRVHKESPSEFWYYATGRANINSFLCKFQLVHRQDLIMRWLDYMIYPTVDKVVMEVVLPEDTKGDAALFVLCRKFKVAVLREEHDSGKELLSSVSLPSLPESLVLMAESGEGAREILPAFAVETLAKHAALVESIVCTDLNTAEMTGYQYVPHRVLTCVFKLPSDMSHLQDLMEMIVRLTDHLGSLKLSTIAKGRVDKNRRLVQERLEKKAAEAAKEAQMAKKDEKREKDKQMYESMTPAEKAKWDEKEDKRKKKEEMDKRLKMKRL